MGFLRTEDPFSPRSPSIRIFSDMLSIVFWEKA